MKKTDGSPKSAEQDEDFAEGIDVGEEICLFCGIDLSESDVYHRYRVCPECGFYGNELVVVKKEKKKKEGQAETG